MCSVNSTTRRFFATFAVFTCFGTAVLGSVFDDQLGPHTITDGSDIFVQDVGGPTTRITNRRLNEASGNIQNWSSNNLIATFRQTPNAGFQGDWIIHNPATNEDVLVVGKRNTGGGKGSNPNFMWVDTGNQFFGLKDESFNDGMESREPKSTVLCCRVQ